MKSIVAQFLLSFASVFVVVYASVPKPSIRPGPIIPQCRGARRACSNNPCKDESCPRFPKATCVVDYCNCGAIFFDQNNKVIPKFSCPLKNKWPQCLKYIRCPSKTRQCKTGCTRFSHALCSQNCDCSVVFTSRRNGEVLNDRCNYVKLCPPLISPLVKVSYKIDCSDGNRPGSVCRVSCPAVGQILIGRVRRVTCMTNGKWSQSLLHTSCDYDRRCPKIKLSTGLDSRLSLCPICPSRCPYGEICCARKPCGSSCIPVPEVCPKGVRSFPCRVQLCSRIKCYSHPNARCRENNCGSCSPIFTNPDTNEVIPLFACRRGVNWPGCLSKRLCLSSREECRTGCPGVPNALCLQNCDCETVFVDRKTGKSLNSWECKRAYYYDKCSPLFDQYERYSCTNYNNIGSVCTISCPPGKQLTGQHRITCDRHGKWSPQSKLPKCVLQDRRCPKIRPFLNKKRCSQCPSVCLRGQICCPANCGTKCTRVIPLPVQKCKVPVGYTSQSSFSLRCSNVYNIGSVCSVVCPERTTVVGSSQIKCLPNRIWNRNLVGTRCVPKIICPPGVPQAACFAPPCQFAKCHAFSSAICVDSFCGGCNAVFFLNGRRLSQEECSPKVFDKRCPPLQPDQVGICTICPPACEPGDICCPTGCGSQCIQIPKIPSYK